VPLLFLDNQFFRRVADGVSPHIKMRAGDLARASNFAERRSIFRSV
jgi:hypothetical protein